MYLYSIFLLYQAAGIRAKEARSIGISVDHRRKNRSVESLQANVARLTAYKSKLIVFPRKAGKVKKGDADAATVASAKQLPKGSLLPKPTQHRERAVKLSDADKKVWAYPKLRKAQSDKK